MSTKFLSDLKKAYVQILLKHDKLYHFEDSPAEIITRDGKPVFTPQECEVVSTVSSVLLDNDELFQFALATTEKESGCINCGSAIPHEKCGGNEPKDMLELLKCYGWQEWHTGGGCTALRMDISEEMYVMITEASGCHTPTSFDDDVIIGIFNEESGCQVMSFTCKLKEYFDKA